MKKLALAAAVSTLLVAPLAALAADPPKADPDLAPFRTAYTAGKGIAYVVTNDDKGEHVYRFGDASRQAAVKDARGYMLFTCAAPHVFAVADPKDKAALQKAKVVHAGEPGFADLDKKYLSGCRNPMVKSAVPAAGAAPAAK